MNKIIFQLQYKNQNGVQSFAGATYRILKSDNKSVLVEGVADNFGKTKVIELKKDEMIYIQMYNKNKKKYESPYYKSENVFFKSRGADEVIPILITRTYFQIRLTDAKWNNIEGWSSKVKFGTVRINDKVVNGRNSYISSDEIKLTENNKVSIYLKEYNSATVSPSPFVSVTVIDPKGFVAQRFEMQSAPN